ncbi:MAG TPA: DUF4349 domain-containing protein [Spirochaetota bacterium]|nr:DUF4349 domain-containing protein [Spirochaetota bacterium]
MRLKNKTIVLTAFALAAFIVVSCGSLGDRGRKSLGKAGESFAPVSEYDAREGASGMLDDEERNDLASPSAKGIVKDKTAPRERMVVYTADFSIEVESIKQSLDTIGAMVKNLEGFIESVTTSDSYGGARVVLRVPVKRFDEALAGAEKLGNVLDRSVTASDVTMEFNDITLRIDTAKRVRERMYELLKRVTKVEDRVKILREIERLTEQIDMMTTRMNYLAGRARFSTITLGLRARVKDSVRSFIPSPFPWIAGLTPDKKSIFDNGKKTSFDAPAGFFALKRNFYEGDSAFLVSAPDGTTGMRLGLAENYPPADIAFWAEAFELDVRNRMYKLEKSDEISGQHGLSFRRYLFALSGGGRYLVAFAVGGDSLYVVEAVSESEAAFARHAAAVEVFIKSARSAR